MIIKCLVINESSKVLNLRKRFEMLAKKIAIVFMFSFISFMPLCLFVQFLPRDAMHPR